VARGRGFFERFNPANILRAIVKPVEDLFKPTRPQEPRPRAPRERKPPRKRPPDPRRAIWNDHSTRGSLRNHWEDFMALPGMVDEDEDEQMRFWDMYVKYMVAGEGRYRRNDIRNPFWQATGIHPDNYDWQAWRETMGYRGARR
jgi:hypothetical protein